MIEATEDEQHSDEYLQEGKRLLRDIQRLCETQFVLKDACQDLYERHADFQSQLQFVKNHEPHVPEDDSFCKEGEVMELHTIFEFLNLLSHTAQLSKLRALFERDKISRALRALNESYSRSIAHVHTFLPESHALFQPPPSPTDVSITPLAHKPLPIEPAPHLDQPPDPAIHTLRSSANLLSLSNLRPTLSVPPTLPNKFEEASHVPPEASLQQAPGNGLSANLPPPAPHNPVLISRVMPTSEVVAHLSNHGCRDITDQLDLASSSNFPVSNGGFGDVYMVKLRNGTRVAVKTMRVQVDSTNEGAKHLKHAARELHTWAKCDHPNVLKLLGLAKFRDQIGMVSMWMEHGSLPGYLSREPTADRCQISTQICEGLTYLHRSDIIHGDLKGLNVLVSDDGTPMLADFGNAILRDRTLLFTVTTMKASLSPRWAAPEILEGSSLCSMEADVYALGMTILETITGNVPYFGKGDHAVMFAVGVKQELPARPEDTIPSDSKLGDALWSLLVSCWLRQPEKRPTAGKVAGVMRTIQRPGLLRDQPRNRSSEGMHR
ncbi:hypothetical protein FS749_011816 [Ceratobasidium sp. UAMH 11750]|nr:hypothetical protein FS749_011816 [Ceratobasidium sp. UAMH 11750]